VQLKSIYIFGESCRSCYTEHNKISSAIFGFFCDLLWILQVPAKTHKGVRNLFARRTLERLNCSQLCPYLAHMPLEKTDQVIGSSGMGAAEEAEFLRGACRRGPRKGEWVTGVAYDRLVT
jgi:hypothetical protein